MDDNAIHNSDILIPFAEVENIVEKECIFCEMKFNYNEDEAEDGQPIKKWINFLKADKSFWCCTKCEKALMDKYNTFLKQFNNEQLEIILQNTEG